MKTDEYVIPEGLALEFPRVVFHEPAANMSDEHTIQPNYFDTLKRIFVLLENDTPPGREIHNIVQAHFGTGMRSAQPLRSAGTISQADLRTIMEMENALNRLAYGIAVLLDSRPETRAWKTSGASGMARQ
jgi:hypothetical protein